MNAQRPWAPLRLGRKPAAPPAPREEWQRALEARASGDKPLVDYQSWNCFEDVTPTKRHTWAGIVIALAVFACALFGVLAIVRSAIYE